MSYFKDFIMSYFKDLLRTSWIFLGIIILYATNQYQKYGIIIAVVKTLLLTIWYFILLIIQALIEPIVVIIGVVLSKVNSDLMIQIRDYVINKMNKVAGEDISKLLDEADEYIWN